MSVVLNIMEVKVMINDETKRKLSELNLSELVTALENQQRDIHSVALTFDERIQRLVDYLYQEKYNSKIQRLMKLSKFMKRGTGAWETSEKLKKWLGTNHFF